MHPGAELVDHLLVQLADAPSGRARLAGEEDAEQASVRDGAAGCHRDDPRVAPALDDVGDPIPRDPGLELGELVGRVRAREHAEHRLQRLARQRLEWRGAGDGLEEVRHGPRVHHGHRDDLLGEHVERVAGHDGRLDRPVVHALDDDRRLEEVAAELREEDALRGLADLVAGSPDPLQARCDARRRLDEDDEVDRAHVDAQLERGRRHERRGSGPP